jgi:uncharacterized protein YozE (UPF0346 family)
MINKLFNKLLLPKHANDINIITSNLSDYWERTNDFSLSCMRYLQDLNTKFELGFNPNEISEIVTTIIFKCYESLNLKNANTMRLYGEFIYYGIFGGKPPSYVRNKKETIFMYLVNFEDYVIENPTPWNDMITKVLDRKKFIL